MPSNRLYSYVGPNSIQELLDDPAQRFQLQSADDVLRWITETGQDIQEDRATATFIIDENNRMWIADQRSEHVVCARGQRILSAGEITFEVSKGNVEAVQISNQSTGYCPDPDSWPAVSAALATARVPHPDNFTSEFLFRRCNKCETINIIKDEWFECAVCQSQLSQTWNIQDGL